MTRIAAQYIMQAELLAAHGGSPILSEIWILSPTAARPFLDEMWILPPTAARSLLCEMWTLPPTAARPSKCEMWILQPAAAKSTSHTKCLRTAVGSEESRREETSIVTLKEISWFSIMIITDLNSWRKASHSQPASPLTRQEQPI